MPRSPDKVWPCVRVGSPAAEAASSWTRRRRRPSATGSTTSPRSSATPAPPGRALPRHDRGCGELAGSIEAASKFLLSWNDVFDVCSTEAALIAGNVNNFAIDLEALDSDARTGIVL